MDNVNERLQRFETHSWKTSDHRKVEATLCQLQIIQVQNLLKDEPNKLLGRIMNDLQKFQSGKTKTLNEVAYRYSRELIENRLKS